MANPSPSTYAPRAFLASVAAILLVGSTTQCAAQSGAVAGAVITTAIAAGASAGSRAAGGCYASCPPGTTCNAKTGLCDEIPCRGRCSATEECDTRLPIPTCVAKQITPTTPQTPVDAPPRVTPQ